MKLAALGILALVTLALSSRADAECARVQWVGTPPGATIPQHGSLYLYDQLVDSWKHKVRGPIIATTEVGDHVVRLDYETHADELELRRDERYPSSVFDVSPHWKPPAAAPRAVQYWHHQYRWTCSSADSLMIQIDQPTAAFRVFWQFGDHPSRTFVMPARTDAHNINVLELGKIDCGSTSIDPAELAAGGTLTLVAIRYDGSEVVVTGLPARLSTRRMPTAAEGLSRAIGYQAGAEPVAPVPVPVPEWPLLELALMFLTIVLGGLLFVFFRQKTPKPVV